MSILTVSSLFAIEVALFAAAVIHAASRKPGGLLSAALKIAVGRALLALGYAFPLINCFQLTEDTANYSSSDLSLDIASLLNKHIILFQHAYKIPEEPASLAF
jgi:hypothetical protein